MILRPYQIQAVDFLRTRKRAFVIAPAGSGKTLIASHAAASVTKAGDQLIWLANTREQCAQARDAIAKTTWPHPIKSKAVCVASKPDCAGADILIIDEAHHLPAASWTTAVLPAAGIAWGFSATPWSTDIERNASIRGFFLGDNNFYTIARHEVLAAGAITSGYVTIHDVDTELLYEAGIVADASALVATRRGSWNRVPPLELMRRALWEVTLVAVRINRPRNARIISLASEGSGILILVSTIEHGNSLAEKIPGSRVVHSRMGTKARAQAIADARSGALRVMIATSLADEGLDVPRLAILINAAGGRSAAKLEQRAGRVMRPFANKLRAVVHDFLDRGASLAHAQAKARIRTYKKLGYQVA